MEKRLDLGLIFIFFLKYDITTIGFEKLYKGYRNLVYGIAFSLLKNKHDSEDIVQTVFTKVYSIDKSKLPSKNEASWLYSVTKNETLNFMKKKKDDISLDDIYEIPDNNNEITKLIDQDNYNSLISKLDNIEKEIVSLKILANFSFEEIGKLLNKPTGTIKWKYYKSINTLKLLLSNLSMFIILFIAGMKMLSTKKQENVSQDFFTDEEISQNNAMIGNLPSADEEHKDNSLQESLDRVETDEEEKQETIIQDQQREDINYVGLGIISISAIFLISTIFFAIIFTKYQLKRKRKSSK